MRAPRPLLALLTMCAALACGNSTGITAADGGPAPLDAGPSDGGRDAGPDAGDAGVTTSKDAGVDAGPPPDAGPPDGGCYLDDDCPSGQFCDDSQTPASCLTAPIKHVVIIVKENHSFDNYFGSFPGAEGTTVAMTASGPVPVTEASDVPPHDLCHEHSCALTDLDNGQMDGWKKSGGSDTGDGMAFQQYYEQDIPNYWQYARNFGLADHFFSGDLGPSFPGHLFPLAAQSGTAIGNPSDLIPWGCDAAAGTTVDVMNMGTGAISQQFPCFDIPSLPDILPSTLSWRFYATDYAFLGLGPGYWTMFNAIKPIHDSPAYQTNIVDEAQFASDVQGNTLPAVSWLVNQNQDDEHPSYCISVCHGENFTVDNVNAVMQSDLWKDTAILITWDDFGGWYDHVKPPVTVGNAANPFGWGMRLPLLLISPYARPGYVYKTNANHASLLRFTERVLGIHKTLHDLDPNAQDALVDDLFGAFDFHQQPLPPLILQDRQCPDLGIPLLCASTFGGSG